METDVPGRFSDSSRPQRSLQSPRSVSLRGARFIGLEKTIIMRPPWIPSRPSEVAARVVASTRYSTSLIGTGGTSASSTLAIGRELKGSVGALFPADLAVGRIQDDRDDYPDCCRPHSIQMRVGATGTPRLGRGRMTPPAPWGVD